MANIRPPDLFPMRLIFLGTGTSLGVPMIGCPCEVCHSGDPRDKRFRSSVLIQNDKTILIDTTPDFRSQALLHGLNQLDAVVYTHSHNDHIMGFDDLRRYCAISGNPMPIYGSADTLEHLETIFPYAFNPPEIIPTYVRVLPHIIRKQFEIGQTGFLPLRVIHGTMPTYGYIVCDQGVKKAAYIPDCASVPEETAALLQDIPVLIIDGLRDNPHPTHLHIKAAIDVARRARAKTTYLTHLTHNIMHARKEKELPAGVFLAYDGLSLDL